MNVYFMDMNSKEFQNVAEELESNGWSFRSGNIDFTHLLTWFKNWSKMDYHIECNRLLPGKQSNARRSFSKSFGMSAFPLHTDGVQYTLPPRFLLLRNLSIDEEVASSFVVDGYELAQDYHDLFYNSIFWIGANGVKRLTPLINSRLISGYTILRYNPLLMTSLISKKGEELRSVLENCKRTEVSWRPESSLVLDNWRVLHSRAAVLRDQHRRIERYEYYVNDRK